MSTPATRAGRHLSTTRPCVPAGALPCPYCHHQLHRRPSRHADYADAGRCSRMVSANASALVPDIAHAVIGIARSARAPLAFTGLKHAKPSCCRSSISMLFSLCRQPLRTYACETKRSSTAFFSGPLPKRCLRLRAIQNGWGSKAGFFACAVTAGDRTCTSIHICTVSCPEAVSHLTESSGSMAPADSFCR